MGNQSKILLATDQEDLKNEFAEVALKPFSGANTDSIFNKIKNFVIKGRSHQEEFSLSLENLASTQEAINAIKEAKKTSEPFSIIFLPLQNENCQNLAEDLKGIWSIDPELQIVLIKDKELATNYEYFANITKKSNLFFLNRPFDECETYFLLHALVEKYQVDVDYSLKMKFEKTEQELDQARNYMNNVFEAIPSVLITLNKKAVITQWNKTAEDYTGIPSSEALSKKLWETIPFFRQYKSHFNNVVKHGDHEVLRREEIHTGDEENYLDILMNPLIYNDKIEGVVIQIDDITETVKKDDQLRQSQKMDSVGNMAAGIAHDFNNIIGGIESTVSSIKFSLENAKDHQQLKKDLSADIDIIDESTKRGSDMINQLLSMSRRKEQNFSTVDLKEIVRSVLKVCERTFDKSIEIKASFDDSKAYIQAFPTQIEQSLINLCVNASHAMTFMRKKGDPQGGTLSLSVEKIAVGEEMTAVMADAHVGDYWLLGIIDTGVGMSKATVSKIYDPFFTTKEKGQGTGLGLSMVFNIIKQHNGFIDVYSEPEKGTTFFVFLPAVDDVSADKITYTQTNNNNENKPRRIRYEIKR